MDKKISTTKLLLISAIAILLPACTSTGGVNPTRDGNLAIHVSGDSGFISPTTLQEEAYETARNYCSKKGKQIEEVDFSSDSGFGKFPKVSLIFNCI
ncbi:hypothetical protein [Lacimicrobium sp. SS2-24]|uniref:hypothetical protein n=1 Tax=Lacimicrobium sp. SS2-24 TaxID=2005569 RepID=UPI000B4BA13C|nr:hypothetical protein [Lacimicrobium sp. SS2-24]